LKKKQRLILVYGTFGTVTVALCAAAAVLLLPGAAEIPDGGLVPGVTDALARGIPRRAPTLRFARIDVPFRHFRGARRTRRLPEDMGSGVAIEDLDGDGHLDLFFVDSAPLGTAPGPCLLFRNRGGASFERVETDLPALHGMGVAAGDYDADGDFDLYVTGYGANVLLRNDGRFRFTDVTAEAGVEGGGFSAGACWGDADGDGDLDLYVCRYVVFDEESEPEETNRGNLSLPATLNPSVYPAQSNLLFLNEDGRFTEAAERFGVANPDGKSLGALFADFDGDGVLDLYVANDVTDNAMYRGVRGKPYEDASHASCTADWRGAMGLAAGDPDVDGDLDLFITHWKPEENALYVREDGLLFRDDSLRTYLGPPGRGLVGWACGFVDLDCDGRPDLFVVNGDTFERPEARWQLVPMYAQLFWNGGERFWDLAPRAGPALQDPFVGRGGAAGDLDRDGDQDLVFTAHGAAPLVLRNDTERRGGEIVVVARGSAPNLFAYGATVLVEAGGRRQVQAVGARVAYLSSGPHELHFGLGESKRADRVLVRFPSGRTVERRGVPAGRRLVVKEVDARSLGPRMDAARDALAAGKRNEARRILREVVQLDPAHASALYLLAQLSAPEAALGLCRRLLAMEPMAPRGHLLVAKILSDPQHPDAMDLDLALEHLEKARRLNRDETGGAFEQGRVYLLKGEVERAAEILERVYRNPRAAALAALCRFRLGQPERARTLLGFKGQEGPEGIAEEGDTEQRRMGGRDLLARLLVLGRGRQWRLTRLPLEPGEALRCAFEDIDRDGRLDARVGSLGVLLQGMRVNGVVRDLPAPAPGAPRLRPYSFEEAARWALAPPARCDGPPPGTTATCEADADGDGDLDLFVACGGDDPAAPLPWWVLLREADGYRPVRGALPEPGFRVAALAAADLDGDGRAEVLLKGGGFLPGDEGTAWIASLER